MMINTFKFTQILSTPTFQFPNSLSSTNLSLHSLHWSNFLSILSSSGFIFPLYFLPDIFSTCRPRRPSPSAACPDREQWKRSVSEEVPLCERSCQDIYTSAPVNCSGLYEGCVCREGLYRNTGRDCVIPALCPCHDLGRLLEVNTELHPSTAKLMWQLLSSVPAWLALCLRSLPIHSHCYLITKKGLLEDE